VNNKVGAITSVAKGIMCIPAILSGLPGIATNIAKSLLGSIQRQIVGIVNGLTNLISDTINGFVNQIAGIVSTLLKLEATILAAIGLVVATINNILNQVNDIFEFSKNQENCRFAAAELSKCIIGSLLKGISKKMALDASKKPGGIDKLISDATKKLAQPGNVIEGYTRKLSNSIDKATSQINTSKLI
jgi:uncharacterized membrane protein required for colicin V production